MIINIIAAIGPNRELGKDNKLLWHIPEDLKRFKKITSGKIVVMGRKTYESLGKPLPNRNNIIITHKSSFTPAGCKVVHSFDELFNLVKTDKKYLGKEIFIIGGGEIYRQALPYARKLYLTIVEGRYEADTFFPDYSQFKKTVFVQKGESSGYKHTFLELVK